MTTRVEWHNVKDKLPNKFGQYLVAMTTWDNGLEMRVLFFDPHVGMFKEKKNDWYYYRNATHWAELPELPKEV